MTAIEQGQWVTRPVADLPPAVKGGRGPGRGSFITFFSALPANEAVFRPRNGYAWSSTRNATASWLIKTLRDRKIHSRIDRDADGIWFWWEPRP